MNDVTSLSLLKADLEITTDKIDSFLSQQLSAAAAFIAREGITLTETVEDTQLNVMYAAYLYRRRKQDNPVMPKYLRWALNNRLMHEKMNGGDSNG